MTAVKEVRKRVLQELFPAVDTNGLVKAEKEETWADVVSGMVLQLVFACFSPVILEFHVVAFFSFHGGGITDY